MQIIGFHPQRYSFDDGNVSEGYALYLGEDIDIPQGKGKRTERVYLSLQKLKGYVPCLGDEVFIDRSSTGAARGLLLLKPYSSK